MFFDRLFPGAVAIADPTGELYRRLGVERGDLRAMFGPASWSCGIRAVRQGHRIGRKIGDPWTMPTIFAVRDRTIVWEHRGRHPGDHPDVARLADIVAGA